MNTFGSKPSTWAPIKLWHRFHVWRAMRMYSHIAHTHAAMLALKAHADFLIRKHSIPPAGPLFDRLNEEGR